MVFCLFEINSNGWICNIYAWLSSNLDISFTNNNGCHRHYTNKKIEIVLEKKRYSNN